METRLKDPEVVEGEWQEKAGSGVGRLLFSEEQIQQKVDELGREIVRDYDGLQVVLVGILNGCLPFMADLMRSMNMDLEVDFMSVSSYGGGTQSSGVVRIIKDLNFNVQNRHVLLVEDIIDTGLTARYLLDNLRVRHPASVEVCALLDKREARAEEVPLKYVGFECPNRFVVGYGLDHKQLYRNLPYISVLEEDAPTS